jgi:hypothetical protein
MIINYWLARRPQIIQSLDPYTPDYYGKWYVIKIIEDILYNPDQPHLYLHKDGVWRESTFNNITGSFDGYYDSFEEAESALLLDDDDI